MESDVYAKVLVMVSAVLVGAILWRLIFSMADVGIRHQPPMSLQVLIGDDCAHGDESFLFKPNSDAVSAPSRASEKNQAMDRLMAGRGMAPGRLLRAHAPAPRGREAGRAYAQLRSPASRPLRPEAHPPRRIQSRLPRGA